MEAWLGRLSTRRARHYLLICLACVAAGMTFAMVPIANAVTGRYEGLTLGQSGLTLACALPFIPLSVALGAYFSRHQLRLVHDWLTRPRAGQSVEKVSAAAHALPLRLLFGVAVVSCLTSEPIGISMTLGQLHRLRVTDFLILTVAGIGFAVWGLLAAWIWLELCMRPVLAGVSAADPNANIPVGLRRHGVTARLSIGLGSAFVVGACYTGSLTAGPGEGVDGMSRLLLIALGVSVVFGAVLVPLCSQLLLGPVRALIQGTRSVAQGRLNVHLPVTGHDELAELTVSFNTMVAGLRERADLRVRNQRLISELQASRERIVTAADAARRQVERDLHDGAQQRLVTARLKLSLLRRQLAIGGDPEELLSSVDAALESGLHELRELAHGIYPALLDEDGLPGALQYAADEAAIPTTLRCPSEARYRPELEAAVYFTCLEALQNAAKHAGPEAKATITITEDAGQLRFEISDDGVGFDAAQARRSSGLQNIADRIGAIGGVFEVTSARGSGTCLSGQVPIDLPEHSAT